MKYPLINKNSSFYKRLKFKTKEKTCFFELDELLYKPTINSKEHKRIHQLTLQAFEHLLDNALYNGVFSLRETIGNFYTWAKKEAEKPTHHKPNRLRYYSIPTWQSTKEMKVSFKDNVLYITLSRETLLEIIQTLNKKLEASHIEHIRQLDML